MNLKNRTSCLFKIVLFIIFSIFVAEIIVLPKIEHDMLRSRQTGISDCTTAMWCGT